jgi:alpha-beta hydrolase superfamily lysophospholipase
LAPPRTTEAELGGAARQPPKSALRFGASLFGWYHPPGEVGARRGLGILICNPVGDDLCRAHRPLRHLAERLAALGFPVLRFDYRGTGDSAGHEGEPGRVSAWLEDVGVAADELRARSGAERLCLIGLRLGATLAAAAAAGRADVEALVLWSGYPSGRDFVADVVRRHRLHRKLEPGAFSGGPTAAGGEEALGFFLADETIAALERLEVPARPAPRALVVGSDALAGRLKGVAIERAEVPADRFLSLPPHQGALPEEALAAIAGWLDAQFPQLPQNLGPRASETPIAPAGEEPCSIGRLSGILHRPPEPRAGAPAVVLLNAGCVPRFGPHRQYVPLARRWAELGFPVLRLDLSGIGDSPAGRGPENITYPPERLEDVAEALRWLGKETGASRFVLMGLCSGADVAFEAGLADRRVAGLVLMNPRTFCVHDLGRVESFKGARWYQEAAARKESWLKLLRGQVNLWRVAKAMAPKLVSLARRRLGRAGNDGDSVPGRLRALAARGVEVLLLVAKNDPGIDYVDANFGAGMRALARLPEIRRQDLEGTDHTFTALWAQRRVADLITQHLLDRHLPGAWARAG